MISQGIGEGEIIKPLSQWGKAKSLRENPSVAVIHQNGTSPSECQLSLCCHTKGHLWIVVCLEYYSLAYYEIHFASIQLITLPHLPC